MGKVKLSELGCFKNGLNFSSADASKGCYIIGVPDFTNNYIAPSKGLNEVL